MFRRNFLKSTGLLSLAPLVPAFINKLAWSAKAEKDRKILVVLELSGGNDGINTVVPYKDDSYFNFRQKLKLDATRLHAINDSLGLHPAMRRSKELLDAGELAIVNGVGYPNPNRSHFESQRIWHRGLVDSRRENDSGWIGHALDISRDANTMAMDGYYVGRESVSEALVSRRAQVAALSRFSDLQLDQAIKPVGESQRDKDIAQFVQRQMTNAYATARQIESVAPNNQDGGFPNSRLGQQMRLISQLIKSGSPARVYYTVQSGYDTHSAQSNTHANLLSTLSSSLKAFVDDLKQHGLADQTMILAFSEFGRRVQENKSSGTDHGTAGPVFLAGTCVQAGLHGKTTDLSDLVDGDIQTQVDFRRVYATMLDRWLEISSEEVLGGKFEHLDLFKL